MTMPTTTPTAPKRKGLRIRHIAAISAVAGLILGSAVTAGVKPEPVTVTKEVPGPERVVTKTETVEKEVTPNACLTALDMSEQAIGYASDALGYSQDAVLAASKLDADGINAQKDKMDALMPKLKALTEPLQSAKAECRAK
jgi:hypothetical protein